jgi:membrane protein DedA with SNARE-associated domain
VLTGCGLPVPEEVPIIAAGVASSAGSLNPWAAFGSCIIGALLGDCVMYSIGYHFGHGLAKRHPRFAHLLHADREAKIEEMMRRHGLKVFFISRFVVGLRSPIYLTAGILRISFRRFLLIDALCATSVVGTFFWLSHRYGDHIRKWILRSEIAVTVAVVMAVIATGIYFWRRRRRSLLATQAAVIAEALATPASNTDLNGEGRHEEAEAKENSLV